MRTPTAIILIFSLATPTGCVVSTLAPPDGGPDGPPDAPTDGMPPGTCAGYAPVAPGNYDLTMWVGGRTRLYHVHVPPGYSPDRPTPLVVGLHGGGGNAASIFTIAHLDGKSDAAGFLLVAPDGTSPWYAPTLRTWNNGNCCGYAMDNDVDDVGFIRAMLDTMSTELCIDPRRVYATGISNGAMMAQRLACQLADRIAAIAPVAGGLDNVNRDTGQVYFDCAPSRPVPVFEMQGLQDCCYPYAGGGGCNSCGLPRTNVTSVPETFASWAARDRCGTTTRVTYTNGQASCSSYDGCPPGVDVTLCTVTNAGHVWPGALDMPAIVMSCCGGEMTTDIVANDAMWDFFVAHPMP